MALRQQVLLTMYLEDINAYRQEKGRDPIQWTTGVPDPCAELLQQLDEATIGMLNHVGSPHLVKELFERGSSILLDLGLPNSLTTVNVNSTTNDWLKPLSP